MVWVIAFWKAEAVAADDVTLVGSSRVTTTTSVSYTHLTLPTIYSV